MIARILIYFLLVTPACLLADQPGTLGPSIFASAGGRVFARVSYRNSDDSGRHEAYGTAYHLRSDGSDEVLWHFSGISTFYPIEVFLCVDMAHMVVVAPRVGGRDLKKEDWGIAFYDRGVLVKRYAPTDLVMDPEQVITSTGSYFWLARNTWSDSDRPRGMELEFWPARSFWLRTVDGVLYEFDSYTGKILKKEPHQPARPTRGKAPRG